jgi:hypothetical protein
MFRLEDNINMDLKGIVCENAEWIRLDKDGVQWLGVVNVVMNFQVSVYATRVRGIRLGCTAACRLIMQP